MALLVAGAAFAFGHPSLDCGFTSGDDQRFITEHALVARPSFTHALELLSIIHGDLYQPIPMLTFQANYALAQRLPKDRFGVSAFGFHLTNVALHAINALLAAALGWRISQRPAVGLLTGLMFACHPFAVETVAWVSGRMMLLGTIFALGTIMACLGRRRHEIRNVDDASTSPGTMFGFLIANVLWVGSLLSKVMPSVPFAAAWLEWAGDRRKPWDRRKRWIYAALVMMALLATMMTYYTSQQAGFVKDDPEFNVAPVVQVLLSFRYYLENYLAPLGLSPWVPPPDGVSVWSPACAIAIGEIALLGLAALLLRKRIPLATGGIVAFALLIAPFIAASSARRFLAADRYMYLPIIGLHLMMAALLVALSDALDKQLSPSIRHRFLVFPAAALLAPWLMLSWLMSLAWSDTVSRDQRVVAVYPDDVNARYELAKAYNFSGRPDKALEVVDAARERWPGNARLAAQAGEAYRLEGAWKFAEIELRNAAEKLPDHTTTQYHFALVLEQLGAMAEATSRMTSLVKKNPGFVPGWTSLGRLRKEIGNEQGAMDAYERALAINPHQRTALLAMADCYERRAEFQMAVDCLRRAVDQDPFDAQAKTRLAILLARNGRASEALALYDELINRDDSNLLLRMNRAAARASIDDSDGAEQDYLYVASEQPEARDAYIGLQEILIAQRRTDRNLEFWRYRLEKLGRNDETLACMVWAWILAGQPAEAEELEKDISIGTAEYRFARWAWVVAALKSDDDTAARRILIEEFSEPSPSPLREWQTRVIREMLNLLPEKVKRSTAGRFALGTFFLECEKADLAQKAFSQVAAESGAWADAARARLVSTTSSPAS